MTAHHGDLVKISDYEYVLQGRMGGQTAYLHLRETDNAVSVAEEVTIGSTSNQFTDEMIKRFNVSVKKMSQPGGPSFQECIQGLQDQAAQAMRESAHTLWYSIFKDNLRLSHSLYETINKPAPMMKGDGTNYHLAASLSHLQVYRWPAEDIQQDFTEGVTAKPVSTPKWGLPVEVKPGGVTKFRNEFVLVANSLQFPCASVEFMHFQDKDGALEFVAARTHDISGWAISKPMDFVYKCFTEGEMQFTKDAGEAVVAGGAVCFDDWVDRAIEAMKKEIDLLNKLADVAEPVPTVRPHRSPEDSRPWGDSNTKGRKHRKQKKALPPQ
eukprot:GHVS01028206.1.p1 GENE.GHVS01028206.1~~GHVS01028206.1.p1  ORF type:complete len:325 (-),score=27.58 GHVS01028206.1:242-1216(-)